MKRLLFFFLVLTISKGAFAQLERKLANPNQPVDLTFHAPRHINLLTVEPLGRKTMHFSIMHTFGTVGSGVENFFGLDNGATIQFSFEFGLTEKLSLGVSRTSQDKVYSAFGRYHLLQQTQSNSIPVSVSLAGGAGIITNSYQFLPSSEQPSFQDRWVYSGQVMVARRFSPKFSGQLTPMMGVFANPLPVYQIQGNQNFYLSLGMSGKWKVSERSSLTLQFIPNLNTDLRSNVGIGWDVEAGGHVFQMYFVTSQSLNEAYLLAGGNGVPGEGFRLGFNVNRVFAQGQRKAKNQ